MLAWQAARWVGRTIGLVMCRERAAEVPEYVIVVAIIAMLAVVGLVAVKAGLLSNLNAIASCLTGTAVGTASSCT